MFTTQIKNIAKPLVLVGALALGLGYVQGKKVMSEAVETPETQEIQETPYDKYLRDSIAYDSASRRYQLDSILYEDAKADYDAKMTAYEKKYGKKEKVYDEIMQLYEGHESELPENIKKEIEEFNNCDRALAKGVLTLKGMSLNGHEISKNLSEFCADMAALQYQTSKDAYEEWKNNPNQHAEGN